MAITSKQVTNITQRASGGVRASLQYSFSDGRQVTLGPSSFASSAMASAALVSKEPQALAQMQRRDAEMAVTIGSITAYKEATQEQVYFAWLSAGYNESDPAKAHSTMAPVATPILAMGLTPEQMAVAFGSSVEEANAVLDRWAYLDSHAATLAAYRLVAEGDV